MSSLQLVVMSLKSIETSVSFWRQILPCGSARFPRHTFDQNTTGRTVQRSQEVDEGDVIHYLVFRAGIGRQFHVEFAKVLTFHIRKPSTHFFVMHYGV